MAEPLSDAVYRGITRQSPATEQRAPAWRIAEIERRGVPPSAGAAAVGVTRRTWNRWKAGTSRPSPRNADALTLLQRRVRLTPGRERRLRSKQPSILIRGVFRVSRSTREREIDLGSYARDDLMDDVVDAYLAGDDERAGQLMADAIDEYVSSMDAVSVDAVYFGL